MSGEARPFAARPEASYSAKEIAPVGRRNADNGRTRYMEQSPRLLRPRRGSRLPLRGRARPLRAGHDQRRGRLVRAASRRSRSASTSNVRRLRRDEAPADDIDDIFADDAAPRRRRNLRPVSDAGADVQVHFVTPRNFNDAQEVADRFKRNVPVILNLQSTSADLSKRLIDFSSGLTYALDGGMQKIADKTFMLTPANVEVSAEEKARLVEKGFFNQSYGPGGAIPAQPAHVLKHLRRPPCRWSSASQDRETWPPRSRAAGRGHRRAPIRCCSPTPARAERRRSPTRSAGSGSHRSPRWPIAPTWSSSPSSRPASDEVAADIAGPDRCGDLGPRSDAAGAARSGARPDPGPAHDAEPRRRDRRGRRLPRRGPGRAPLRARSARPWACSARSRRSSRSTRANSTRPRP